MTRGMKREKRGTEVSIYKPQLLVMFAVFSLSCSPEPDEHCQSYKDCIGGFSCRQGTCVAVAKLAITTQSLPLAYIDTPYRVALEARGGIPPYRWSLDTGPDWLDLNADSGLMEGTPDEAKDEVPVIVRVLDSSTGESLEQSHEYHLSVRLCVDEQSEACTEAVEGVCMEGLRTCKDGQWSLCQGSPSMDLAHCGPGCDECPQGADTCDHGLCKCGSLEPCEAGQTCCSGVCADLQTATEYCGGCDTSCMANEKNASGASCKGGVCDYLECDSGYLDCDGDRTNGCEQVADAKHCGDCNDDCTNTNVYLHTTNQGCDGDAGTCTFECVPGYDDCNADISDGCETPLSTGTDCGQCFHDCAASNNGHQCLEVDGAMECGCVNDGDCAQDDMCCGGLCLRHNVEHCPDCDTRCTIGTGGLSCQEITQDTGDYDCLCSSHDDCKGIYPFSLATCRPDTNQCTCQGNLNCEGTLSDMCCLVTGVQTCVDLLTDVNNCGTCGKICADGQSCVDGACTCESSSTCPENSGAPNCQLGNVCGCNFYGGDPCPPGQFCCQTKGCCLGSCDTPESECSDGCISNNHIWCWNGCCESCNSEADCPPMP